MRPWITLTALLALVLLALAVWTFAASDASDAAVARAARPAAASRAIGDVAPVAADELASSNSLSPELVERAAQEEGTPVAEQRKSYKGATVVRGRVLADDERPVEGARILAAEGGKGSDAPLDAANWDKRKGRAEATSNGEGEFQLDELSAGPVRIAVRASGFAPLDLEHRAVPAEHEFDLGDLVLVRGVRMAGVVVDSRGAPIADAALIRIADESAVARAKLATDCGPVVARSGADGAFAIDCQAAGPWMLLVHSEEHLDLVASGTLAPQGAKQDGLVLRLASAASIDGVVRIAPGPGTPPLELVTVHARRAGAAESAPLSAQLSHEVACGSDGRFHIGGLIEDDVYVLTARAPLGDKDKRRDLGASIEAIAGDVDVELAIGAARVLIVGAVDARRGTPVTELEARWSVDSPDGRGRSLTVDATVLGDGRQRLVTHDVVESTAQFAVELSATGYRTLRLSRLDVEPGRETVLGTQRMDPLGMARVRVLDALTGSPIKGAHVSAELTQGDDGTRPPGAPPPKRPDRVSGKSGRDGIAELFASTNATAFATAVHDDYARSEMFPITFGASDGPAVDVALEPGGGIEASVVDANGEPLVGARVFANSVLADSQAPGASVRMTKMAQITDSSGVCVIEPLAAGTYAVRLELERLGSAKNQDTSSASATVDVLADVKTPVTLRALPRMRIWGRVTEAGAPVVGAQVTLAAASDADREWRSPSGWRPNVLARTDEDGHYEVAALGPGNWTIAVEHPSRLVPFYAGVELVRTDVEQNIVLSRSALLGRVVDAEGRGIEGARVVLGLWRTDRGNDPFAPLLEGRAAVLTDAAGNFEIRGPPAGRRIVLEASLRGFQTVRSQPQAVGPEDTVAGIELVLRRGARIEVELSAAPGSSLRGFVYAQRVDIKGKPGVNDMRSTATNARGLAKLEGLAPGRWRVMAWRPRDDRRQAPSREVTVDIGATARIELELRP